ncbi:stress response protein NST1 [Candida albicans Ca529L]|nr:stress response protein NST1 [Candida albicans Ca529L]
MSDIMDRVDNSTRKFKLGDNIHFEISSSANTQGNSHQIPRKQSQSTNSNHQEQSQQARNQSSQSNTNTTSRKKRKKHKKKSKISTVQAHLNNPEDDYPTSRVIKQAPNGDVIVESLEDEDENHHHHEYEEHEDSCEYHPSSKSNTRKNSSVNESTHNKIWDSASIEEQQRLKEFWESLDESKKLDLVKIDKDSIMRMFKNETRHHLQQQLSSSVSSQPQQQQSQQNVSTSSNNGNSSGINNNSNNNNGNNTNSCACKYCGRRNSIIEEELESIYDNHFDDIIDFIHEVRDINDLNALPGLLFGGFHMLEEERRLQKRQQKYKEKWNHSHHSTSVSPQPESQDNKQLKKSQDQNEMKAISIEDEMDKFKSHLAKMSISNSQSNPNQLSEIHLQLKSEDGNLTGTTESQLFNKLLDPKLFEALENMDLDKMKEMSKMDPKNLNNVNILEKATSLREIVRDLNNADRSSLQKGISHVSNMGKFFSNLATLNNAQNLPEIVASGGLDDQLSKGLSSFAEDLLKNDGNSFIGMMEALSESRTAREELLKETVISQNPQEQKSVSIGQSDQSGDVWVDDDDENNRVDVEIHACDNPHHHHHHHQHSNKQHDHHHCHNHRHRHRRRFEELDDEHDQENEDEELEDDEEDYYDEYDDDEEEDEEEDDDDDDIEEEGASDTESEISEEEKMQEIRRLFLIQVIKLFQERLKNAYKEKLSQDRTQKLIEELEAEENAKKERELKKLKQKEKAKEKKRLQQLAKEEERKRKEEELKAKEEEQRLQKEKLKAEQKKRKEEARLKKEEEKKKKIEEQKRKEEEHRKKVEAQQKREAEAKKLKEERRRKAEEERKQKEEEKKQKELLKKQKEEEKRQKELLRKQREEEKEKEAARLEEERTKLMVNDDDELARQIEVEKSKLSAAVANNPLLNHLYQPSPGSAPTTPSTANLPALSPLQSASAKLMSQQFEQQHQQQVSQEKLPQTSNIQSPNQQPHPSISSFQFSSEYNPNASVFHNNSSLLSNPSIMNSPRTTSTNLLNGNSPIVPNVTTNISLGATNTSNLSPWSSKSRLNSLSNSTQPFIGGNQFTQTNTASFNGVGNAVQQSGNFSPFNALSDPLVSDAFKAAGPAGMNSNIWLNSSNVGNNSGNQSGISAPTTTSTNTSSRNNSIWGNTNPNKVTEPSLLNNNNNNNNGLISVESSGLWNSNGGNNQPARSSSVTGISSNLSTINPVNSMDIELIQSTTFNCFQILQNSGQLEFGVAPLMKLFQNVKTILNKPSLTINQFLNCCTINSNVYLFSLKHDDFGNVTHVEVAYKNVPRTSPPPPPGNIVQNQHQVSSPSFAAATASSSSLATSNVPLGFINSGGSPTGLFNDININHGGTSFLPPIGESSTNDAGSSNVGNSGFGRRLWN